MTTNEGPALTRALSLLVSALHARGSSDHAVCTDLCPVASFSRSRAAQQLDCSKLGADQHTPRACAKQSTPWQPCCAGALLLQFARHTQHASAARRQRRRRWPNRARASRGAPSPTAPTMIALLTGGCAGANFHREVHQCEHWYSESDACWCCASRASGGKVVCGPAHAAARELVIGTAGTLYTAP